MLVFVTAELDDLSGGDIYQVVMRAVVVRLISLASIDAEIALFQDTFFLKKADCPVDGADRDPSIKFQCASKDLLDTRMIG
jgi:hypothetical protein